MNQPDHDRQVRDKPIGVRSAGGERLHAFPDVIEPRHPLRDPTIR